MPKQAVLPAENIRLQLCDLKLGEAAYFDRQSLVVDPDRGCWIRPTSTVSREAPSLGFPAQVTRVDGGVRVSVPADGTWTPHSWDYVRSTYLWPVVELELVPTS